MNITVQYAICKFNKSLGREMIASDCVDRVIDIDECDYQSVLADPIGALEVPDYLAQKGYSVVNAYGEE